MQNAYFGSEIKIPKNMSKFILQIISMCCVQKTAPKNTKYSRNETVSLCQKLKMRKRCEKTFYKNIGVFFWKTKYLKNDTILKIA